MDKIQKNNLYNEAVIKWGLSLQFGMLMEECAELIKASNKVLRKGDTNSFESLAEEMADVEIMIEQLKFYIDWENLEEKVLKYKEEKLIRLKELLSKDASSTKKDDEELLGCQRMYCLVDGCGEVDESNSAYCIKHGRSLHGMCGSKYKIGTGYCKHCRKSTNSALNSQAQNLSKLTGDKESSDSNSVSSNSGSNLPIGTKPDNIHTEIKKEMEKDYSYAEDCIKCTTSELDEGIRKCSFQESEVSK